jgi:hypothetical protein
MMTRRPIRMPGRFCKGHGKEAGLWHGRVHVVVVVSK